MTTRKGLALLLLFLTTGFASNQALSRNDIYQNIGSGFAWTSTAPAWNGDHTIVTKADFTAQVHNNGNCAPGASSNYVMVYSDMQACAISSSPHSPILANNSFAGGSFLNWTDDTTTGCTSGVSFGGSNATDEDADSGYAAGSSGSLCSATPATIGLNQSFSIAAAPTVQSVSIWYQAPFVSVGDGANCTEGTGNAANLTVKINGTVASTLSTLALDSSWHQFTFSTTLLTSGANTVDITAALTAAVGVQLKYNISVGDYTCSQTVRAAQPFYIDNASVTATY